MGRMSGVGAGERDRRWSVGAAVGRFLVTVLVAITFAFVMEALTPRPGDEGPLLDRYVAYWTGLLEPAITARVLRAMTWTIAIMGIATLLSIVIGTLIGAWLGRPGRHRLGLVATGAGGLVVLAASVPTFFIGMGLIAVFTHTLRLLPPALPFSPTQTWNDEIAAILDLGLHAIMPITTIALAGIGASALTMRALVAHATTEDHAAFAESLGLAPRRILVDHGIRPSLAPQATALSLGLGLAVSGAILVEALFSYPGLGFMLWRAVQGGDLAMVRAITVMLVLGIALAALVLDLVLPLLDPRIRR